MSKKEICRYVLCVIGYTLTVEWAKSCRGWDSKQKIRPLKVRLAYIDSPEITL
jgi:hypothetical protein